jgi:hypothetical protein
MTDSALPPEVDYPLPPWRTSGRLWIALARADADVTVPHDVTAGGSPRRLVVAVVRYETGTLTYDEFSVGSLVRRGARIGVLAPHIWVDEPASLWGGRRLWGIPKRLGRFEWRDDGVSIHDGDGPIADLVIRPSSRWRLPTLPVPAAGFGQIGDDRTYLAGRCRARISATRVDITGWSPRLPRLAATSGVSAYDFGQCRFAFPAGRVLGPVRSSEVNRD